MTLDLEPMSSEKLTKRRFIISWPHVTFRPGIIVNSLYSTELEKSCETQSSVGHGNDRTTIIGQHPSDLAHRIVVVFQVFEHLAAQDQLKRSGLEWQRGGGRDHAKRVSR